MRAAGFVAAMLVAATARSAAGSQEPAMPPQRLCETGLYAVCSSTDIDAGNVAFSPQYPLWSDGATKRRWLRIPAGKWIDASRADEWDFPRGTKLWKEFSHGRRIETRMIERLDDGSWRFAAYVWNEQGTDATLVPQAGIAALPVRHAPTGRYTIPGEADCRACHEGAAVPVLGASALQLSPDRDLLAPHAEPRREGDADLRALVARGWLRNLPESMLKSPPQIAAATPEERAALGYLHGNCGHCHNDNGSPPPVDLVLAQGASARDASAAKVMRSLLGGLTRYRASASDASRAIEPGHPDKSVLVARMRSRNPQNQMPPLGTQIADSQALDLIERWIRHQPQTRKELQP